VLLKVDRGIFNERHVYLSTDTDGARSIRYDKGAHPGFMPKHAALSLEVLKGQKDFEHEENEIEP
jgi:hypothetical protein